MKYIKTYDSINNEPQIGDYVVCEDPGMEREGHEEMYDFITTNIGQITNIADGKSNPLYYIHYNNVPDKLKFENNINSSSYILDQEPYRRKNITMWSKNKEDLEIKIQQNKFNL